ncbi:hypothetical protein ACF1AJ_00720 [Leifsonia sp. NPDC014704]|uniref:hypothetical protein n=1 Tax=Leifsonia sp. NPDC014704 TaxID=3364123 RepID=UPI0036F477BF
MGRHLAKLDDALTDGPFTTRAGAETGVTRSRMRGSDLITPIRGVRIPLRADGFEARLRAYALHRERDFAFSHTTAARLYDIPLPTELPPDIHVSVPDPGRPPSIRGFIGHKLRHWDARVVGGLPVTTPEQTWIDLASLLSVSALVVAGDFVIGGRQPLTDKNALRAAFAAAPGRRGIARARSAFEKMRVGAESPGETRLRLVLHKLGLPEPLLNVDIRDDDGRFVARADLAYPASRIALEYEGDVHRVDRSTWMKDIGRRERVEDLGWRMVRVTAADLREPHTLASRVRHLLHTR